MRENLMWMLKQVHLSLEQYGQTKMKDLDLSLTQSAVLHDLLAQKERAMYAPDLRESIGISKSSVSSAQKRRLCRGIPPQRLERLQDDLTIMLGNIRNESGWEAQL